VPPLRGACGADELAWRVALPLCGASGATGATPVTTFPTVLPSLLNVPHVPAPLGRDGSGLRAENPSN